MTQVRFGSAQAVHDTVLHTLRNFDPADPDQALHGAAQARAVILAAATYLQERHGGPVMADTLGQIVSHVADRAEILEPALVAETAVPPSAPAVDLGAPARPLMPRERVEGMLQTLRSDTEQEAEANAIAATVAGTAYLRERKGENFAVGVLRSVEASTSRAAALDRWQPEGGRAN